MSEMKTGKCIFCGQTMQFDTDKEKQSELDEMATENCSCAGAITLQKKSEAKAYIEEIYDDEPNVRNILKYALTTGDDIENIVVKTRSGLVCSLGFKKKIVIKRKTVNERGVEI